MMPSSATHALIAEIHAVRAQLAQQYPNLQAYSAATKAHCQALGIALVTPARSTREAQTPQH